MTDTSILRRFNRSYTQRVGALDDSFLGSGMPLGSARLLFEVGSRSATVQSLRARLGLDSGYLSRLLRGLEERGLVDVRPDPDDRRRRLVSLTASGRRQWQELEARSEERALAILEPLTARQQERLNEALATADLLVRAATVSIDVVDPAEEIALTSMRRYFDELDTRFEGGFDPGPIGDEDLAEMRAPHGVFLVARNEGEPVAAGGVREYDGAAEIKRMWVSDEWRGAGLGSRLLRALEEAARGLGHTTVRLDTRGEVLTEAAAMYERAGYHLIDRYNDNPYATHFFAKSLDPA